jgi:hypothetical protein
VVTFFVQTLALLLNPHIPVTVQEFFLLYVNLYIFYGPMWFIFIGIVFLAIQFFSERKYPIGIFKPPTLMYFLSFTMLIVSLVFYLNYDYYFDFFEGTAKFNFIRVLLINMALVITGIIFVFFKKLNKKWIQILFISILSLNIFLAYSSATGDRGDLPAPVHRVNKITPQRQFTDGKFTRRKIRIVLMDGLSLGLLNSLTGEQKLLNFKEIIKKGVSGRIESFAPNMDIAVLNAALTGLRPSQFTPHSHNKFKFEDIDHEFDILPRFVFFRKSPYINTTTFYKREDNRILAHIRLHYETDQRRTARLIRPPRIELYSERALRRNNRFVLLFPDLLRQDNGTDKKYQILRRCFFYDDYLKNMIVDLKDTDIYYSVSRLPGLGVIGKYFYQYHMPQVFGGISQEDPAIKKYGRLVEKYYEYYDSILGNLMSATGENELLVILSFYEYDPLPVWRRILVHLFSEKDVYVYKSPHSRGTILLYEKNALKKAYPLKTIPIYDIYPTLLYYAGFQLSTDLRGEVLREIFTDEFLLNNPIDITTQYNKFLK